jgi:hypothetical protein
VKGSLGAHFALLVGLTAAGCGDGYLDSLYSLPDPETTALEDGGTPDGASGGTGTDSGVDGLLIDDMEDGDTFIAEIAGRNGAWYLYNDGTSGSQWPSPLNVTAVTDRDGASSYALRFGGSGFTGWGSGVATPLADATPDRLYDASRFGGISFFARVEEGSTSTIRVNFPNAQTTPEGGECGGAAGLCYDYFGSDVGLSTEWQKYTIYFHELTQVGWGYAPGAPFDATRLVEINFFPGPAHDVWVDDLVFVAP